MEAQTLSPAKPRTISQDRLSGADVRRLRQSLDLTQEDFARGIGVTVSTVNRWENGHARPSRLAGVAILGLVERTKRVF